MAAATAVFLVAASAAFAPWQHAVAQTQHPAGADKLDRTVLPLPMPGPSTAWQPDARKAVAPPPFQVRAPEGAPNVLIVLLDDFGFGQARAFGGVIEMPTFERLAAQGARFNRFHTAGLSTATRAALLSGHNAHAVGAGGPAELATAFPGYNLMRPHTVTPLAEILRLNGYATAKFGKDHETPPWEATPAGPFDRWPTRSGFDTFYGFVGAQANPLAPGLYSGTTRIDPVRGPGYHVTTDLADQARQWLSAQQALRPGRPFFVYFAPGAPGAPHLPPVDWLDRYAGRFAMGWDRLREETFARQKALGIVPAHARLTPRPREIPAWDSFTPEQRQVLVRQMEVHAALAAHTDHEVGRVLARIEEMGQLHDTLVFYVAGANGASLAGGPVGTFNDAQSRNGMPFTLDAMRERLPKWGRAGSAPHFALGWGWAGNTPFQWGSDFAGHLGATRNAMAVFWPRRVRSGAAVRSQFHHVVDIAPTVLEAARIPQPKVVNGVEQRPMDGVSMLYSLDDPAAPDRRRTQYFEAFGHRAIYHEGWMASVRHHVPWLPEGTVQAALDAPAWELYELDKDFSQADDVAEKNKLLLIRMRQVFEREGIRNQVFPLDERRQERADPKAAGRPDLTAGRVSMDLHDGLVGLPEDAILDVKNVAFSATATVLLNDASTQGVMFAQGGALGGWAIYMKDGRPVYEQNGFGAERYKLTIPEPLAPGPHNLSFAFRPDDPRVPGSGGTASWSVNGRVLAQSRIPRMVPFMYASDEGADVGRDTQSPVSLDYKAGDNAFTGTIMKINLQRR